MSPNIIPVTGPPGLEPEHPGIILREEFLEPHRLEVSAAAERLGVTRQTIHRILAGDSSVTAEMALRLGKLTGTSPSFWMNLQAAHDLWHHERAMRGQLKKIHAIPARGSSSNVPMKTSPPPKRAQMSVHRASASVGKKVAATRAGGGGTASRTAAKAEPRKPRRR